MPLAAQITRHNKPMAFHWCHFYLASMIIAKVVDSRQPFALFTVLNTYMSIPYKISMAMVLTLCNNETIQLVGMDTDYVLQKDYTFIDLSDQEEFHLYAGDILVAWKE